MDQTPLTAEKRTVVGRKVKTLRRQGIIPAHVFGHKIPTIHVQVKAGDFTSAFEKAGETGIIELAVDGEKRPVLVRNVQIHPVTDAPLHVDFYQVNLAEKVTVNIPLEVVGEAPAVGRKIGLLLTPVSEIEIEALPTDIPEKVEVDITNLQNIGDEIKVKDLKIDAAKIEVKVDPELVVAQIGELVTKEMEAVEAEVEAEAAAAQAPAEGEGVPAAEGEAAPAEGEEATAGGEEKAAEAQPAEEKPSTEETKDKAQAKESNPPGSSDKQDSSK